MYIHEFRERYNADKSNAKIEERIKRQGLVKASINDKKSKLNFEFNIEVPETKIYNQYGSYQCNIYAFIRVVKDILRKNTDLDVNELDLSANYISFYDKLEKANTLYNELIASADLSLEEIRRKADQYIGSFGTFHFCREIVNKYGLVPTKNMPELDENYNDSLTIELLRDKIKCDALVLLNLDTEDEKRCKKKELMYEVYQFLARVYGNPPAEFEFGGDSLTPTRFKEKYLGNFLDEYVAVTSFVKETFLGSQSFVPDIYLGGEDVFELTIEEIKQIVVRQLCDGVSVWFSTEESTVFDSEDGILDNEVCDFNKLLNIKKVSKDEKLLLDLINYDHAMCITGALVEDNKVKQFKVDDSFGESGKYKGRLIMTESFFENCVIAVVVNKKYLN